MRRKTEGNEQMKRAAARKARQQNKTPSEMGFTTGAPRQRKHLRTKVDHTDRLEARHRGQRAPAGARARRATEGTHLRPPRGGLRHP
jgi:hypothetical protein